MSDEGWLGTELTSEIEVGRGSVGRVSPPQALAARPTLHQQPPPPPSPTLLGGQEFCVDPTVERRGSQRQGNDSPGLGKGGLNPRDTQRASK